MTRNTTRQTEQFEAQLNKLQRQSVRVTDSLLQELAAKRDAYLASLR